MNSIKKIALPKFEDDRGNLSFFESLTHVPFEIKRTYWIYDVPGGCIRGGHAFKQQQEFVIALSGSFDISIHDGNSSSIFTLNRAYFGIYIPNGFWREMLNFSTNSLALVVSSTEYKETDYIRDFDEFIKFKKYEKI